MAIAHPISVINETKKHLLNSDKVIKLASSLQVQITRDFAPIWNVDCLLNVRSVPAAGEWWLVLLENSDQADALGYHELTTTGNPIAKVFVKTTIEDGEDPAVTASHELMEMLVDPNIDQVIKGPDTYSWALETCDAVEETTYEVNGVTVSNFQFPSWFGKSQESQYDFLIKCIKPYQLLKGGYQSKQLPDGEWTQVFGSLEAADSFDAGRKWRPQVRQSGIKRLSTVKVV